MKTLSMLWVALVVLLLPVGSQAQEDGKAPSEGRVTDRVGFGVGISTFTPDFEPLAKAFTDIEDQYRAQGYDITPYSPELAVSRLVTFSFRFRPADPIGVALEAGSSFDSRVDFKTLSASVLFFPPRSASVEPYFGAGIGNYCFSATREYGEANHISPTGNGSYTYLDQIESHGGGIGVPLTIGLNWQKPSSRIGLGLFASYLVMVTPVEGQLANGDVVRMNLNAPMLGVRLVVEP